MTGGTRQGEISIGCNGSWFVYDLDYMGGKMDHLPVAAISKEPLLQELHCFDFEGVSDDALHIVYASYEAAEHVI